MLALVMDQSAVRAFMNRLVLEDIFDKFEVRTAEIVAGIRVTISGAIEQVQPDNEISAEQDQRVKPVVSYTTWAALKPLIFAVIKNGQKPRQLKIVFSYPAEEAVNIHTNAQALFINLTYETDTVTFTTATAQKEFALDKSLDHVWDEWVQRFMAEKGVAVKTQEER